MPVSVIFSALILVLRLPMKIKILRVYPSDQAENHQGVKPGSMAADKLAPATILTPGLKLIRSPARRVT